MRANSSTHSTNPYFILLFSAFVLVSPALPFLQRREWHGCDFRLRYFEAECVRSGVDPTLVWNGKMSSTTYYGCMRPNTKSPTATKPVNGYSPWVYAWFAPLTLLPLDIALWIYRLAEVMAIAVLFGYGYRKGRSENSDFFGGLFVGSAALFVGIAIPRIVETDNFGLFMAIFLIGIAEGLEHRRPLQISLFLALVMAKPQIGIPVSLVLIIGRVWKPVALAATLCFVSTCISAVWMRRDPFSLILEISEFGSDMMNGSLLLPGHLFMILDPIFGKGPLIAFSAIAGIVLCSIFALRLRDSASPHRILLPAILTSSIWTYSQVHDHCTWSIIQIALACDLLKHSIPRNQKRLAAGAFALLGTSFAPMYFRTDNIDSTILSVLHLNIISGKAASVLFALSLLATQFGIALAFVWLWHQKVCSEESIPQPSQLPDSSQESCSNAPSLVH